MTNLLMKNIVHTEPACIKTKTVITYSSSAPLLKWNRSARRPQIEKYSQYRLWSVAELIKNNTVKQYAKTLEWIGKQDDVEEGLQELTNETDLANLAIPKQTCFVADHVVNSHSLPCKAWAPLWLQQSWSSLGSRDSWALPTAPAPLAAAKPAVPADALASTGRPCEQPIFVELDGTTAPCSPAPRDEHGVEQAD
uniref:Uncharacterized protein n=1 Tax=Oryza glaberrima TaxID=4538 RepID=I1NYJ0_ORYGL